MTDLSTNIAKVEEVSSLGTWSWKPGDDEITCSNHTMIILGIRNNTNDVKKISLQEFLNLSNSDDVETIIDIIKNSLTLLKPISFYHRITGELGEKFLHVRGKIVTNEEDKITKVIGSIEDISDLKGTHEYLLKSKQDLEYQINQRTRDLRRAYIELAKEIVNKEEALVKERLLSTIVESTSDAIISVDTDHVIQTWNVGAEHMFGYLMEELVGTSIDIITPDYKLDLFHDDFSKILKGGVIESSHTSRITKAGKLLDVSVTMSPIKNRLGDITGAAIVIKDISKILLTERRYSTLLETMNEGVMIIDNDDNITFSNPFMREILQYSENELHSTKVSKLFVDNNELKRIGEYINKIKSGIGVKYEAQLKTKKKNQIWVLISSSPVRDNLGNITGRIEIHTNITNRKLMEQDLFAVANIPEENPNPTFRFSYHGQVLLYANPASKKALDFFDKEGNKEVRKAWIKQINEVYKKGVPVKKELQVDNNTYMCTIVPLPEKEYVNIYAVDITAAKKAKAEIQRLSLILSKTENAVFVCDKTGVIQWVNKGFEDITGYDSLEILGTRGEILRKDNLSSLHPNHDFFKKIVKTKKSLSFESLNVKKSGEEYWTITTLTPVVNEKKELESIIAVDTDITEKKNAEVEILKAKKLAEDSSKTKELFLANMSHEIRTPMNAIMGIIQLLKDTSLDDSQKDYLKSMDFAGENLLRIIDDVLDISKIESGKMSIEQIEFNIREIIESLFSSIKHRATEKGINLLYQIEEKVPQIVIGDPVRLNQILLNLINNAIKFTDKGSVELILKNTSISNKMVGLEFQIRDTGIGIPKNIQELIFLEFEQANKGTTRNFGGTGLGLSIVRKLLKLQGGDIVVESSKGKGATFTFNISYEIPESIKHVKALKEKVQHKVEELSQCKILLVEDNKLNQMVASKFLESMGANVTLAENGKIALEKLKNNEIEIVLMDIQMPELDGYSTTKIIRSELSLEKKEVPILAMTAHAIEGEKDKCLQAGMDDYITKPLKKEALKMKLISLLKIRRNDN